MHIILEGADNAGKTSLADALRALNTDITYHHPGGKPETSQAEMDCIDHQTWLLTNHIGPLIIDRVTPISQIIYNPDPVMNRMRLDALKRMIGLDPLFIYCRPSTDKMLRTQDLTWREGETEEHKQKIIGGQMGFLRAYDELMSAVPCVCYNYESSTAPAIRHNLDLCLRGDQRSAEFFKTLIMYRRGHR